MGWEEERKGGGAEGRGLEGFMRFDLWSVAASVTCSNA